MCEHSLLQNGTPVGKQADNLTVAELIRLELHGKHEALARYDSILWKIRSGYVLVLYGTLSLIMGKQINLEALDPKHLFLVAGFSLLGYILDKTFRVRQLRVVTARDLLISQAMKLATGEKVDNATITNLLYIAGESGNGIDRRVLAKTLRPIKLFYAITPIFGVMLLFYYLISLIVHF